MDGGYRGRGRGRGRVGTMTRAGVRGRGRGRGRPADYDDYGEDYGEGYYPEDDYGEGYYPEDAGGFDPGLAAGAAFAAGAAIAGVGGVRRGGRGMRGRGYGSCGYGGRGGAGRGPKGTAFGGGVGARRQQQAARRADKIGGKVRGARESAWAKGHESFKATYLNSLSAGELLTTVDGYQARVISVVQDHSGGLPKVEVNYPAEPAYGSEVLAGSRIHVQPYALSAANCTAVEFAVSKANKDACMKIFKFLDKDGSGALDIDDFNIAGANTRSGEWLSQIAAMDRDGDGATDPKEFLAFFQQRASLFACPRPPIYARTIKELGAQLEGYYNQALERVIAEAIAFFEVRIPDFAALWASVGVPANLLG